MIQAQIRLVSFFETLRFLETRRMEKSDFKQGKFSILNVLFLFALFINLLAIIKLFKRNACIAPEVVPGEHNILQSFIVIPHVEVSDSDATEAVDPAQIEAETERKPTDGRVILRLQQVTVCEAIE